MLFKRNIWLLLFVVVLFLLIFSAILATHQYTSITDTYIARQESHIQLIDNSFSSLIDQQESLISIIASTYLSMEQDQSLEAAFSSYDRLLNKNPDIAAYGLISPEGKYLYLSNSNETAHIPNLLKQEESRESFTKTLHSKNIVLGRTNYFFPLDKVVIPVRKSIRDRNGEVRIVIALLLEVNKSSGYFSKPFHMLSSNITTIIRTSDRYVQFRSTSNEQANPAFYKNPHDKKIWDSAEKAIKRKYGVKTIYQDGNIFTIEENIISSSIYNARYEYLVISIINPEVIKREFSPFLSQIFFLNIIVFLVLFVLARNISDTEKQKQKALIQQADYDTLTELPNRNYLNRHLEEWIHEKASPFTVFFLDLNNFKNINNSYGHRFGDIILKEIAHRLKNSTEAISTNSLLVRMDGDEFLLFSVCGESESLQKRNRHAQITAEEISVKISTPFVFDNFQFRVSTSIGIALFPEHGNNLDSLIRAADVAILYAKKKHKNSHIFQKELESDYLKKIELQNELSNALDNDEFFMVYQPQVDAKGTLAGVEALIRWVSPKLGFVPPENFIRASESSGQILKLDHFIMTNVMKEIKYIRSRTANSFGVSINISVMQLTQEDFQKKLTGYVTEAKMSPLDITLEITESIFIDELDSVIPLLNSLRKKGFRISLDDFGTGFSSLGLLKDLPVDELKIDKRFIQNIDKEKKSLNMVKNIIAIARNLGMSLVAEGVETEKQRLHLEELGCDNIQGYYFSKPLKSEQLEEYIQNQKNSPNLDHPHR